MDAYIPNRLSEYNKKQKERAEYIERGEKQIRELFKETKLLTEKENKNDAKR